MIYVIAGKKGSGKTKRILDMANETSKHRKGDVVFIDDDNRYMYDLKTDVRFVDAGEFEITGTVPLISFISGMISQNFDIETIFIDGFLKIVGCDIAECGAFFDRLAKLTQRYNTRFVLSISGDPGAMPEFVTRYIQE